MHDTETVVSVLQPHFDAVQDTFATWQGGQLARVRKVKFVIEEVDADPRHFAATHTNGRVMLYSPAIVELPLESMVAILCHEFGHAADFLYPASWSWSPVGPERSVWVGTSLAEYAAAWRIGFGLHRRARSVCAGDDLPPATNWKHAWQNRTADQVEWAADGIAETVTGKAPLYCGPCLVQCYSGIERPEGLR